MESRSHLIRDMQEELFRKQGRGWFRIVSGSMRPLLEVGDRVLAEKLDESEIRPLDILVFKHEDSFVAHRALKVSKKSGTLQILQRGDAGGAPGIIPGENVIGRVMVIEKKGGVLNLNEGGTKILNRFLGLKNAYTLLQQKGKAAIRRHVAKQPGFQSLKFIYRSLKAPLSFLSGLVEKILISRIYVKKRQCAARKSGD